MSSIQGEWIAFDTNVYLFAVRRDPEHPYCRPLLFEKTRDLRVFVPREVVRELRRNLIATELQAAFAPLRRAIDVLWDFRGPPNALVRHYQALGAKKGDAVIAAHLDAGGIGTLVSENRHFLGEIPGLPFRVLPPKELLLQLGWEPD